MNKRLSPALAASMLIAGIAISHDANAGQERLGRFLYGIECDESLAGYMFDDGERMYSCDGREWFVVGYL